MQIQTFSIVAGSEACNARCPFCISKMTLSLGVELKEPEVNWRNFEVACRFAKQSGVTTVMLTGKGEPTLFPKQITQYLQKLARHEFPLIEMQTNGIVIAEKWEIYKTYLQEWYDLWMTTIAISIVHYEPEKNRQVYVPYKQSYINLSDLIKELHSIGFLVRLTCIMANGFIDSAEKVKNLLNFAKENQVEQLTVTPVNKPDEEHSRNKEAWDWTNTHHLTNVQLSEIIQYVEKSGVHILTLQHGAKIFDVGGQNLCLNGCLTVNPAGEDLRNLIFFPDGRMRYYWQYPGSVIA